MSKKPAAPVKKSTPSARKAPAKTVPVKKSVPARPVAMKSAAIPVVRRNETPTPVRAVKPAGFSETRLTPQELKIVRKYLETTRDEVLRRLQEKKSLDMPEAEVGDPIDQASQSLDKEVLFEVTDKDHMTLDQIESALRRMEKGVYGICENCRCVIPQKRLKALPFARYCISCQTSNEASPVSIPLNE